LRPIIEQLEQQRQMPLNIAPYKKSIEKWLGCIGC
jgi:hypothetical protein